MEKVKRRGVYERHGKTGELRDSSSGKKNMGKKQKTTNPPAKLPSAKNLKGAMEGRKTKNGSTRQGLNVE